MSTPAAAEADDGGSPSTGNAPSRARVAWWRHATDTGAGFTVAAAVVLAVIFRRLLAGEVLFRRDVHLMWYAQMEAFARAISAGEWPLWNPDIGFGQPLWADANTQMLYAPTWLNLLVRPWTYYSAYVMAHLLLAALGARALGLVLRLRPPAAAAAGLLWLAGGPLLSLGEVWNQLAGAAWMPWALAAAICSVRTGRVAWGFAWGAATAAQVLAGSPEAVLITSAGALAYAVVARPWRNGQAGSLTRVTRTGLSAVLVALGLSAGQWLPSLAAALESGRAHLPVAAQRYWSVHPVGLVQLFLPLAADALRLAPGPASMLLGGRDPLLPSLYLGLATVPLAAAAFLGERRRAAACLLAAFAACVAVALGSHLPVHGLLTTVVPPLGALRYPVKAMPGAALCWSLLCGLGLETWWATASPSRRRWTGLVFLPAAGLAVIAAAGAFALERWPDAIGSRVLATGSPASFARMLAPARQGLVGAAVAGLAMAALALARTRARPPARGLAMAAAGVAVADLTLAHARLVPTAPRTLFTFRPAIVEAARPSGHGRLYTYDYFVPGRSVALLSRPDPFAITRAPRDWSLPAATALSMRMSLFPPTAAPWGIAGSFDHDTPGIAPARSATLVDALLVLENTPAHLRLLELGGVQRVVALHSRGLEHLPMVAERDALTPEPAHVFAVTGARPRAYAVGTAVVARDDAEALRLMLDPAFDATQTVVLAQRQEVAAAAPGFASTVRIERIGADRVLLAADMTARGYVVLADAWAPGWTAHVDGREERVWRANLGFRAVTVPQGRHEVELRYRAPGLAAGLAVSAASLALLLAAVRSRRRSEAPSTT